MSRLEISLDRLLRPGLGLLVIDEYADAEAKRRGLPVSALTTLADQALHSASVDRSLGGVLVSEQHAELMTPPVARPWTQACVGLHIDVGTDESSAVDAVARARRLGAVCVELRSNRRPGQFPRGENHVAAGPLAAAAAAAQAAGMLPVLSTAMPGLDTSTIGVARAVTVNALSALFDAAAHRGVDPSQLVVRTNLITPGRRAKGESSADAVAQFTLDALDEALPPDVPAVWFMSSGRSLTTLCSELVAITRLAAYRGLRRHLGYAMGRALLEPTLDAMVAGGRARAEQRLAAACDALHRALVPALVKG